ncbi:sensor histidine kinase [Nonomuraea rhizosphaerae]|uniref:sensor histidine kinase n=1 Tax=Nonomuraea rhizosphaerae TaxID=2665663 RepID=UPI001C5D094D|nr:histidine kinase [Nonomuraea rhizosphaerae]
MNETHSLFTARLSRRELIALDLLAGLGFCLIFLTSSVRAQDLPPSARLIVLLGLGLTLSLRRLWPLPVFCLTLALSLTAAMTLGVSVAYISPAYALYIVALTDTRGAWVPTSAIGVLTMVTLVGLVIAGGAPTPGGPAWLTGLDQPLIGIAALGGAWTVGRAVRERRQYAARGIERLAGQAVAEERLRIARELHDVVTHSVGLIAVKAGVANHVMATRPEEAHDALRVIENASRSALVEMRHLLGVLRSDETPDRGPAPGISGLQGLAAQARLAGVEVELDIRLATGGRVEGGDDVAVRARPESGAAGSADDNSHRAVNTNDARTRGDQKTRSGDQGGHGAEEDTSRLKAMLPDGVELSVYRIVQEALTNVVKHAAPAKCRVSVVADTREVRIEVVDDGHGRRTLPVDGTGHGLIGMRERVMMYDGVFEAGRLPGRGFRVLARLPYGGSS